MQAATAGPPAGAAAAAAADAGDGEEGSDCPVDADGNPLPCTDPPEWAAALCSAARAAASGAGAGRGEVYPPSDDSFLMLEVIARDRCFAELARPGAAPVVLDVGCGSGVLGCGAAALIRRAGGRAALVATDRNPLACAAALQLLGGSGPGHHSAVQSDLAAPFRGRGAADVVLFNPPYVVTPPEEMAGDGISISWAGGSRGREVIDRFLPHVGGLLSPGGMLFMCGIEENAPGELADRLRELGLRAEVVARERRGIEALWVLRAERPR
eukprot:TRINITY_DN32797_c0_g1_i1.p1 TRINITY_DN32797_c0_g1~~TRINITY_DN32797_c0_g1_i1.p1  ORF type:complete len:297 (+),score=81.89 TRINITY_DN32797_c0_g1_i1:86-892(+)